MNNPQEYFNGLPPVGDRRLKARVTPRSFVEVTFADTKAIVVNVSESGMALAVGNPSDATNCLIRIRFQLPTSGQSIEIFVRVVRLTKSKRGVGVRLIDLTPDAQEEIANWIASERSASDLGRPVQILQRNKKTLEISARQTKRIFSSPDVGDRGEIAAARFATIFPSERTHGDRAISALEKAEEPCVAVVKRVGADESLSNTSWAIGSGPIGSASITAAAPEISVNRPLAAATLPTAQASGEPTAPKRDLAAFTGFGWQIQNDRASGKRSPRSYIFDLTGPQLAALVYVFALVGLAIGIAATKASVDVLTAMGYGPFARHVRVDPPSHTSSRVPQMPAAPPPDLTSKEWVLNVKPGAPPSAENAAQPTTDQTNKQAVSPDSITEKTAEASPRPGPSPWSAEGSEPKAESVWDFQSDAKKPAGNSESTSAEAAPSRTADQGVTDSFNANAAPSGSKSPAESEASANRRGLSGLIARSAPQRSAIEGHARSAPPANRIRSTSRSRGLTAKNAVVAEPKSSSAANQKRTYPAVVVGPMHGASKNRTRAAGKSEGIDGKSAAANSKGSGRAQVLSSKSSKRDDSELHATKSEGPQPATPTPKHEHVPADRELKNSAAAKLHTERGAKSESTTSHAEHAARAEEAKKSNKHAAPAVIAKNVTPARPDANSSKAAAKTKKTTPPSNPTPAENSDTPTVSAVSPKKGTPESPAEPVAKLAAPASPTKSAASSASSKPANPALNASPKSTAPEDLAPSAPNPPVANPVLSGDFVSVPSKPGRSQRVTFPQKQVANSSSLAISSQLSVVVPAASGAADQQSRLQAGKLVSYVLPHNPRPGDHYGAEETVKVMATVGQQGFVTDIKPVTGPIFLLSSTISAVRSWRYKPTLVNGTPVETHQDVTITFKLAR